MYSKQQKEAYQSIHAPADLRDKVLTACEQAAPVRPWYVGRPMRFAISMAAMFLLCFTGISSWHNSQNPLKLDVYGPVISDGSVSLADFKEEDSRPDVARYNEQDEHSITLKLDLTSPAKITISGGEAEITDPASDSILTADKEYSAQDDLTLVWNISSKEDSYEMTVQCGNVTYHIPLTYNAEEGSWMIRCQKN